MAEAEEQLSLEDAIAQAMDAVENDDAEETVEEEVEAVVEEDNAEEDEFELVADNEAEPDEELDVPEVEEAEPVAAQDTAPAPASWKPLARESWSTIPAEAQEEIIRREAEIEKKLGEISEKSAQANAFEQAVEPFRQTIAIEAGGDAIAATRNLMGVATRLRMGTPQEKAMVVRDIISQYGVDIETLDNFLANQAGPPQGAQPTANTLPPQAYNDPRIDQMWNMMSNQQQQAQQSSAQQVESFLSGKEWGNDVRNDMADLMDLAARRGENLSLDQAYDRAVAMRPDLQQILQSRQSQSSTESLRRKKRAAKQISGAPASGPSDTPPETLAGAISAAWDQALNE